MNADRDDALGKALRALPTPEHGPEFWASLDEQLADGTPPVAELNARRATRRFLPPLWLLSAAAAVVVVVAAVVVLDADEHTRVRLTPPATTPSTTPATEPERPMWTTLPASPLSARRGHAAVWTGRKMLVWGGQDAAAEPLGDGAIYDPSADRWEPMAEAPTGPLFAPTAVWTSQRMLVWGGRFGTPDDPAFEGAAGASYDPVDDSWTPISPSPLRTVTGHVAVWTGDRMLVWGGNVGELPLADGASYDPATDRWTKLAAAPLDPRFDHTAVWTGDRMIVFGGFSGEESASRAAFSDGASYDPVTNSWAKLPPAPLSGGRALHTAVWTGSEMVVWGGTGNTAGLGGPAAAYDPSSGTWRALPRSPLAPRVASAAVVAHGSMLLWGGNGDQGGAMADGAAYDPVSDAWRLLPASSLGPTAGHSAVWTGTAMIVWGGADGQTLSANGAALRIADGPSLAALPPG